MLLHKSVQSPISVGILLLRNHKGLSDKPAIYFNVAVSIKAFMLS